MEKDRDLASSVDINGLNLKLNRAIQRSEIGGQPRCFGWDIEQYYRYSEKNQQKKSRYKTYHILIIMKILVVNKTNIMLIGMKKKTINNPNENR